MSRSSAVNTVISGVGQINQYSLPIVRHRVIGTSDVGRIAPAVADRALSCALAAIPVALVLTITVIVKFDLSLLWSLPLYCATGSATFALILIVRYLADK